MGGGIAQVMAMAGIPVNLADASPELTVTNLERLNKEAAEFEAEGLFPAGSADRIRENLSAAESIEDAVRSVDYIAEAVPEVPAIKQDVHSRIDAAKRPEAIVGSNTSTIQIESMAPAFADASTFLGVHFSNPSPFIPGVEIIAHPGTDENVIATVENFVSAVGKVGARIKDNAGFVLNRLQYVLLKESIEIVEEGIATAEDVDKIVSTTFGFRTPFFGPFVIADMAGLDVYKFCFAQLEEHFGDKMKTPKMLTDLVDAGKLGTKSGGGFTDLTAEQTAELIAYRNKAYARLSQLIAELGPPPTAAR
ncbi:3-hydroxyacyl-CoA dehydrogenase family protein [Saxibacter everestensis]|uniref:3-hydroxyacyl-CoA dehydrogenase family protein n=2 Tax=Saxibacter everestensis TaxID=2909229 RepID=A0ABY8R0N3_9MICO|nr:3-hydroxyacyl-CoA dehydrogenase family protein [Brevibacteriaceae bacterium ZFBP1038]